MPGEVRPPVRIIATSVYIIASLVQLIASPIYLTTYILNKNYRLSLSFVRKPLSNMYAPAKLLPMFQNWPDVLDFN